MNITKYKPCFIQIYQYCAGFNQNTCKINTYTYIHTIPTLHKFSPPIKSLLQKTMLLPSRPLVGEAICASLIRVPSPFSRRYQNGKEKFQAI